VASVTVLHSDCVCADAWASALTVLGPGEGMALAEHEGLAARMLMGDRSDHVSPALAAMIG